jgi:hypothetical protein
MAALLMSAATSLPRAASAQDSQPQRTAITKENLPGVYRVQVAIYALTVTIRPDGSFVYESPEAKAPSRGTWTLADGRFEGVSELEGGEKASLAIDLKSVSLEELEKGARVTLASSRLGKKPIPALVTRLEPCEKGGNCGEGGARKKGEKAPALGPLEELEGLADALAGRCSQAAKEVCRWLAQNTDEAAKAYRGLKLPEKAESLLRQLKGLLPKK